MEDRIWHKSYHPEVSISIDYEDISMPEILARTAKEYPDRDALIFMGKKITYLELDQLVNRFANAIINIGIKPGDRVSLLLPNIPQIVIAYYAIWRAGAVPVPNNPLYTDRELEHQFRIVCRPKDRKALCHILLKRLMGAGTSESGRLPRCSKNNDN